MHMTVFQMFVLVAMVMATGALVSVKVTADRQRASLVPVRIRRRRG